MKALIRIVAFLGLLTASSSAAVAGAGVWRVAVLPVRADAYVWGWQPEAAVTPLLESAILASGRAVLVERRGLDAVLEEQILRRTGLVDSDAMTRIGGLLGADLLVLGHVTEASLESDGRLWTPAGEAVAWRAAVTLSVRVVAVSDGQVLLARTVRGSARGLDFRATAGGVTIGARTQPTGLLSQAAQAAIDEIRPFLAQVLSRTQ